MKNNQFVYVFGGAIGDALLGVHLGRVLSTSIPGARLTLIATRKNDFVHDLLQPIPFITFIEMPKWSFSSLFTLFKLSFYPHYLALYEPISATVPLWWGIIAKVITIRMGSVDVRCVPRVRTRSGNARAITFDCRTESVFSVIPNILTEWGIVPIDLTPHLDSTLYQGKSASVSKPYIIFHFFAPFTIRSEPIAKAREILSMAREAFPSHRLILTCAKNELLRARRMAENIDAEIFCDLDPATMVSLIAGADVYVGVDTGITHIACHLDVPCVVLGNRSNPCWLPYYAKHAVILFEKKRCGCAGDKTGDCREDTPEGPVYRCLFDISTESVLTAIKTSISSRQNI